MTIVKRRVCDWYRSRRPTSPVPEDLGSVVPENAIVARDLLRRIDEEASSSDRRTLGWLVREHDGESLLHIAAEERFAAPCIRQRIRRLRVSLRMQHLAATFALLLAISVFASSRPAEITADPSVTAVMGDARGTYRITALSMTDGSAADRALLEGLRLGRVRIENDRIVVEGATTIRLQVAGARGGDVFVVRTSSGAEETIRLRKDGSALVIVSAGGPLRGEVRLERE